MLQAHVKSLENDQMERIIGVYQQLWGDVPESDGATVIEPKDPETADQEAMEIATEKEDSCKA